MIFKTGYYNWHNFGLKDSFYPDDMPEEWRLTFYANEIECVQISLSSLKEMDDVDELFENLTDQFSLIIYCDDVALGDQLASLLENDDISINALVLSEPFHQKWSQQLDQYSIPCLVESKNKGITFDQSLSGSQLVNKQFNILYLDELLDLKNIRLLIEQWVKGEKAEEYYLLLNPSCYKSSAAGELRLLIEMMGY